MLQKLEVEKHLNLVKNWQNFLYLLVMETYTLAGNTTDITAGQP